MVESSQHERGRDSQAVWALALVLLAAAASPVLRYAATGRRLHMNPDMLQEYLSHGIMRDSILRHRRFPLWTPYVGGGYPLYAHPHDASMILPLDLPVLLCGEVAGIKLNVLILYGMGCIGAFLIARAAFPRDRVAAFVCMLLYASCPFFVRRLESGNYNELLVFTFPAILLLYLRGHQRPGAFLGSMLLMVALVFFGKFSLLYTLLALAAVAAVHLMRERRGRRARHVAYFAVFVAGFSALSMVKAFPMLRLVLATRYTHDTIFKTKYFAPIVYFGGCMLAAWLCAAAAAWRRRRPGSILAHLLLFASLAAPLGLAVHCTLASHAKLSEIVWRLPLFAPRQKEFFQIHTKDIDPSSIQPTLTVPYFNFLKGTGVIDWHDDKLTIPTNVQPRYFIDNLRAILPNPNYHGDAHVVNGPGGVYGVAAAPNEIRVTAAADGPTEIEANFNYDPAWTSHDCRISKAQNGLILISIGACEPRDFVLTYRPTLFYVSLAGSLVSLAILGYLFFWNEPVRRRLFCLTG